IWPPYRSSTFSLWPSSCFVSSLSQLKDEAWEWLVRVLMMVIRRAMIFMTPLNRKKRIMKGCCQMRAMIYWLWITLQQVKSLQSIT
ncbi:hypothetical protein Prudu_016990, partial [Prunus dulcis]